MVKTIPSGVWTAIITPFEHSGSIDWKAYETLVQQQVDARVTGIVVSGTTGEAPTLSNDEKIQLIKATRDIAKDRMSIMAGAGGNDTAASIELSQAAIKAGAESLLIVTPPYNKPSHAGLKAHFSAIAKATNAPICLYHVPGRTSQRLTAEAISDLCEIEGVVSVKEASGDITLFTQCVLASRRSIMSGDDFTYLASLAVGGTGCISVASNVFPKAMVSLTAAYFKGDIEKARKLNDVLFPLYEVLFCESNPSPAKACLAARGLCRDHLRLPLVKVTEANKLKIEAVLKQTEENLARLNYE